VLCPPWLSLSWQICCWHANLLKKHFLHQVVTIICLILHTQRPKNLSHLVYFFFLACGRDFAECWSETSACSQTKFPSHLINSFSSKCSTRPVTNSFFQVQWIKSRGKSFLLQMFLPQFFCYNVQKFLKKT